MNTPPLIQTVPAAAAVGGTLPAGSSATFFPSTRQLEFGSFNGLRASAGVNFNHFGLDASGFWLGRNTRSASLFSTGVPFAVARSYVSAGTGQPVALFASSPGRYVGTVATSADSRMWGLEGNVRRPWYVFLVGESVDAIAGFRYLNLEENLIVASRSVFPDGGAVVIQDAVRTRNEFYGPQVALYGRFGGLCRGLGLDRKGRHRRDSPAGRAVRVQQLRCTRRDRGHGAWRALMPGRSTRGSSAGTSSRPSSTSTPG